MDSLVADQDGLHTLGHSLRIDLEYLEKRDTSAGTRCISACSQGSRPWYCDGIIFHSIIREHGFAVPCAILSLRRYISWYILEENHVSFPGWVCAAKTWSGVLTVFVMVWLLVWFMIVTESRRHETCDHPIPFWTMNAIQPSSHSIYLLTPGISSSLLSLGIQTLIWFFIKGSE